MVRSTHIYGLNHMEKRYQVFVSSTYRDLQDERQEVMQALLELDCIPAGMELFPAANEDQWTLIRKVIEDCDYYMVILAGRYGSVDANGVSYTELEYRYAIDRNKPVLGFVHRDPGSLPVSRCESDAEPKRKLDAFTELVKKKMCRFWDSPADLGSQVSRSLVKLIKTHPGIGWVRGDLVPDVSAAEDMLRLRKRVEELEGQLARTRQTAPEGTANLVQGDDVFRMECNFSATESGPYRHASYRATVGLSWNDIFASVSPKLIDELTESGLRRAVNDMLGDFGPAQLKEHKNLSNAKLDAFKIDEDDFQTIKVQLRALGLIAQSTRTRSVKDAGSYWALTPYGDTVMTRLRAILRDNDQSV
jgi:hypothetical protein